MSPTDIDPVQVLRERTRDAHRALESTPPVRRLMADTVGLGDVDAFLCLSYRFFTGLERALGHALSASPLYRARSLALGDALTARGLVLPPAADTGNWMEDEAALLGVIYTVEGSSLGAAVIDQHLRARLGAEAGPALDYFRRFGRDSREHWMHVVQALRCSLRGEAQIGRACDGAIRVFDGMHALFERDVAHCLPSCQRVSAPC